MHLKMAVHEPNPRIICLEPDQCPSSTWNCHCIPLWWVHQVETCWVSLWVEISKPTANDEEIMSMDVDWVVLHINKTCVLQHELQVTTIGDHPELGAELWVHVSIR